MGCVSDVLCLPFKMVGNVVDAVVVVLFCPCRYCWGCPKTSRESSVRYG